MWYCDVRSNRIRCDSLSLFIFHIALFIHAFFKLELLTKCTKKNMQMAADVFYLLLKKLFFGLVRWTRVHLKMFV